jgi:hypothetical protein
MLRRALGIITVNEVYRLYDQSRSNPAIGAWNSSEGDLTIVCRCRRTAPGQKEHEFGSLNCRTKAYSFRREVSATNGTYKLLDGRGIYKVPAKPRNLSGPATYWEPPCGNVSLTPPVMVVLEISLIPNNPESPSVGKMTCTLDVK